MFIASRLQELGHEVRVYASNAAYAALKPRLPNVSEIPGLVLEYENNQVKVGRSFRTNRRIWRSRRPVIERLKEELCGYRPHLVITDFEPFFRQRRGRAVWDLSAWITSMLFRGCD
jgi:hypothetical protein